MRIALAIPLILATLLPSCSPAAEVSWAKDANKSDRLYLEVTGEIRPGDAAKLRREAQRARWNFIFATGLIIDSPGGSVSEALEIAKFVESAGLTVHVADGGQCASSCFFVYVSAPDRGTYSGSVVVHRPYFDMSSAEGQQGPSYEKAYRDTFTRTRQYLADRLVPNNVIDAMMSKGSFEGYKLTRRDLDSIGPWSPALREYMYQTCGLPTDRVVTQQEIQAVQACELEYLRKTRFKYLFGAEHEVAVSQWKKLDGLLSDLSQNASKPEAFTRAFSAATRTVNKDPPTEWLKVVRNAVSGQL